jgi:fluoride ion exporter CrcB/FEX
MPFPAFSAISTMIRFFLICLGGAAGTGARYLLSSWMLRACGDRFPYGTLAVNVIEGGGTLLAICDSFTVRFSIRLRSPGADRRWWLAIR